MADAEHWALLYLHDWDQPKEGQEHKWEPGKNVFPEISAIYQTLPEAVEAQTKKIEPGKYWIKRVRVPGVAQAAASPTAEDIYACCQSTLIGFRDELTEQQIKFICDQIARKSTLPSTDGKSPQSFCGESDCTFQDGWCKCGMEG